MSQHTTTSDAVTPASTATHAGDVRIEIAQGEGKAPISITIGNAGGALPKVSTELPDKKTPVDAPAIEATHVAAAAMKPAPVQTATEPDTTIFLNQLFEGKSPEAEAYRKLRDVHEPLSHALRDAFAPELQSIQPDVYEKAMQAVHEVMQHMMAGDAMLRVPADEMAAIQKVMATEALKYVKNHSSPDTFNADALKESIQRHPKVKGFKDKHSSHTVHGLEHEHKKHAHPGHGAVGNHAKHQLVHHQGRVDAEPEREHTHHAGA